MDANRADRLAQTRFDDDYILSCGSYFVTGRYLPEDVLSCNLIFNS